MKSLIMVTIMSTATLLSAAVFTAQAGAPNNDALSIKRMKANAESDWHGGPDHYLFQFSGSISNCNNGATDWATSPSKSQSQILQLAYVFDIPVKVKTILDVENECWLKGTEVSYTI